MNIELKRPLKAALERKRRKKEAERTIKNASSNGTNMWCIRHAFILLVKATVRPVCVLFATCQHFMRLLAIHFNADASTLNIHFSFSTAFFCILVVFFSEWKLNHFSLCAVDSVWKLLSRYLHDAECAFGNESSPLMIIFVCFFSVSLVAVIFCQTQNEYLFESDVSFGCACVLRVLELSQFYYVSLLYETGIWCKTRRTWIMKFYFKIHQLKP